MFTGLKGRDFIDTVEWTREELDAVLELAKDLKRKSALSESHKILAEKTLFMLFYNPSLRTRNSFEAGMTQLGGHAHYLQPETVYSPTIKMGDAGETKVAAETKERVSDTARVLERYGHGIAIRIFGKPADWIYGRGNQIVRDFAKWSKIPIINMEDDMFHPCQAMADILTIKEKLPNPKGKKLVMSWAYAPSPWKPLSVPHSVALIGATYGMDVVLAHPKGFELDPKVIENAKRLADENGGSFEISYDMKEAFRGADVVYPKSWTSIQFLPPKAQAPDLDSVRKLSDANKSWICDQKMMDLCQKQVFYMHCLPADRGFEVTDEVMDGSNSVIFDEAENRLHAQKAIMALIMS
jgi:N-acetylornithine carbamoyltransferase